MSYQSSIKIFFKSKANKKGSTDNQPKKYKRRSLSLIKPVTPTKSPKMNIDEVIDLCSDNDDDFLQSTVKTARTNASLDCSQETIFYTPVNSPTKTPSTSIKQESPEISTASLGTARSNTSSQSEFLESMVKKEIVEANTSKEHIESSQNSHASSVTVKLELDDFDDEWIKSEVMDSVSTTYKKSHSEETPKKSLSNTSQLSQPSTSYSSPQKKSFYSPSKKKKVVVRKSSTVKSNLGSDVSGTLPSRILFEDDFLANSCKEMDDNTIFLLEIISKFLGEPSLKELLDTGSQELLSGCFRILKPGMMLVCRLYWRKPGWYKEDQLFDIVQKKFPSIKQQVFQDMLKSLKDNDLIIESNPDNMSFNEFVALLNRNDLKQICKDLKIKINSKQNAIEALKNYSKTSSNISNFLNGQITSNAKRVLQMMNIKAGRSFKLSILVRNILRKLYIIMYLGMDYAIIRERRLELVLLYDKIKKETYPVCKDIDNASVVFRTRSDFEKYLTAHDYYEDFLTRTDVNEKCEIVKVVYGIYKSLIDGSSEELTSYDWLPNWLHRYTAENLYVKILEEGIKDLKRSKWDSNKDLAVEILTSLIDQTLVRQHRKAEWYMEKALILHNLLRNSNKAAEVLIAGFKSNLSEEAKDSMRPRAKKIAKQKNVNLDEDLKQQLLEFATKDSILENNLPAEHIFKQPMERLDNRGKLKFETRVTDGKIVHDAESYCVYHYLETGEFTHGEHWEGRIIVSIFFLLFWDIIYSKPPGVKGVFLSHYQRLPLDLYTDSFYENRKQQIEDWFEVLQSYSSDKMINVMKETWDSRCETELSLIERSVGWECHRCVAACLGARRVSALCRRLATAYRYAHSGFPDLTLWNVHSKRIKFVEVKTDTDKPSMKQIQWMQYLREHDMETEFCYIGTHTTRQRSRATLSLSQKSGSLNVKTEL